ncbi:MAG: response regulator [Candidatus Promineifilaceae bacterium]|jgi:DNA-binding NarL/FixJ family response regulator
MASIKLLIVDDHPVFRQGLRDVFATDDKIEVIGEAGDSQETLEKAYKFHPDVILMDINLPGSSGLQATTTLLEQLPETRVVMITGYDDPEQIFHSLRAGAVAFCSKDMPPESLINTVHTAHDGKIIIQQQVFTRQEVEAWIQKRAARFGNRLTNEDGGSESSLTPREMEILELICLGVSNKDISRRLGISYQTVKNHVTAIFRKLGVNDRTQAALYALKREWFEIEPGS